MKIKYEATTTTSKKRKRDSSESDKKKKRKVGKDTTSGVALSPQLLKEMRGKNDYSNTDADDPNALVLSTNKPKKQKTTAPQPQMTKRKQRKLHQLQEKKRKENERGVLMQSLDDHKIDDEHLKLLKQSKYIGVGTETTKNIMERAALHEKAGLKLSDDSAVVQKFWAKRENWKDKWDENAESLFYGEGSAVQQEQDEQIEKKQEKEKEQEKEKVVEVTEKPKQTATSQSSDFTVPFLTLDFGFGQSATSSSTEKKQKKTKKTKATDKKKRVRFSDEVSSSDEEEEEIIVGTKNTESDEAENAESDQGNDEVMDEANESENKQENDEEEDESKLNWKERIFKISDGLIDELENRVKDEESRSILLAMVYNIVDLIPEDSDDEGESDNEEDDGDDMTDEIGGDENEKFIFLSSVRESLATLTPDRFKDENVQRIQQIIEEIDASRTDEQKQIKYTKFYVPVSRKPEIEEQRSLLPVTSEEQSIMEKLSESDITILCGETGSGKTTQIPQFLYEAGYGNEQSGNPGLIGVTQPRRVAALSTAKRVAEELNVDFGSIVSYQVRYDHNISAATKIKFMTDGILVKEIQDDPLLLRYSVLVLDEAHERNVNTDILIGWLSRFIPQRNLMAKENQLAPNGKPITPLKLIVMSATLRVDDFTKNSHLFSIPPPVINIQSRQYPVTVHFNKRTVFDDYVEACYQKIIKIHEGLPAGGILVFLTGKQEIDYLVMKLRQYARKRQAALKLQAADSQKPLFTSEEEEDFINDMGDLDEEEQAEADKSKDKTEESTIDEATGAIVKQGIKKDTNLTEEYEERVLFTDNIKDEKTKKAGIEKNRQLSKSVVQDLYPLPLYSLLQPDEQLKVFEPPPRGSRLCVIATNVAETSLTIPGIRYVIDTGRVKDKEFDKVTGVSKFVIKWTSKASADQRAGRAGRTGPGHCYRLFSSALYDQKFQQFTDPEIILAPIDTVILQMKAMGIKNVEKFPFPTPPDEEGLRGAVRSLVNIEALEPEQNGKLTSISKLGKAMNNFPLNPRYAKMLILSKQQGCLKFITAIVSALTVQQIFLHDNFLATFRAKVDLEKRRLEDLKRNQERKRDDEEDETDEAMDLEYVSDTELTDESILSEEERRLRQRCGEVKRLWEHPSSDLIAILKAIGAYEMSQNQKKFCSDYFLHMKNMKEVHALMQQLKRIISDDESDDDEDYMTPPSKEEEIIIRQIICAGLVDRTARLATESEWEGLDSSFTTKNRPYISIQLGAKVPVFIHPSSYLHGKTPEFICYNEISKGRSGKIFVKGVTAIQPNWLTAFAKPMVTLSKPLDTPAPRFSIKEDTLMCFVKPTFKDGGKYNQDVGANIWDLPTQEIPYTPTTYGDKVYSVFGKLLVEGKVFKDLKPFREHLVSAGAELESMTSEKSIRFMNALKSVFIVEEADSDQKRKKMLPCSRSALIERWKKDKKFLLAEYLPYIKKQQRSAVQKMWPPKK